MEERYIASIDLGTSKFAVCVAKIQDQNVQVVYYKESPSQGIRYSYVFNPKKVENELCKAISEAQQELRIKIQQVIVGLPRYYVRQETASASTVRADEDAQIEESEIRTLKSMALESYPLNDSANEVIYGAVAQSFSTGEEMNELENDIVGMTAAELEGNFKVFIGNRRHSINIDNIFKNMGITIAKKYFTPGITAKAVLKDEQMENGVALIDIGAGVCSVTIFKGKIMRFYSAVPFGGNSVTNDIKSECNIAFTLAENIKKAYGACMPNKLSSFGEKIIQINEDNDEGKKKIPVKYLSEIITARMKEIIEAMLYEIQLSGYAEEDQLRAGVVITGGGAELVNCANLVKEMSGYSVKIGNPRPFFSCQGCERSKGTGAATSMGMIMSARNDKLLNCTTKPLPKVQQTIKVEEAKEESQIPDRPWTENAAQAEDPRNDAEMQSEKPQMQIEHAGEEGRSVRPAIERSVAAGQNDEQGVFDGPSEDEKKEFEDKRKKKKKRESTTFKWIKHRFSEEIGSMFDELDNEEV